MTHPTTQTQATRRAPVTRNIAALSLGLTLALSAFPFLAHAEDADNDPRFDEASASLFEGRYDEAEQALKALIADRGFAPGALQNLGEVYLAEGELGRAIVSFERARLLAPNDPSVVHSLTEARERAGVTAWASSRLETIAALVPARQWLGVGVAGFAAFITLAVLAAIRRRVGAVVATLSVASGLITAACATALFVGTFGVETAVVVAPDAVARVSPFLEAEAVTTLRDGQTVSALASQDGFVEVQTEDGRRGWVSTKTVELIVPGHLRQDG